MRETGAKRRLIRLARGNKVVGTVFVECSSMYRTAGSVELKSLGETELPRR